MKKILSVFVLALVFLFTSVNETYAERLSTGKKEKGKKEFKMRAFIFKPLNDIIFAVTDDGEKYNIFYVGDAEVSIVCAKEGADVTIVCTDGKQGVIRIEEVRLSKTRNKVLVQKIPLGDMEKLKERFTAE